MIVVNVVQTECTEQQDLVYTKLFKPFQNNQFQNLPNNKSLHTTISDLMKMAESFPDE